MHKSIEMNVCNSATMSGKVFTKDNVVMQLKSSISAENKITILSVIERRYLWQLEVKDAILASA
jgi:hypothetical protein